MRTRRCVSRHNDNGSIHGTCINISHNNNTLAVGSDSGVVNLYNTQHILNYDHHDNNDNNITPIKSFLNLTTPIDGLIFNHDDNILSMFSRRKKDCMKLIHVPTLTTFTNWPTTQTPLHYVSAASFSNHSGYMSIGNARGRVLLYRLNHYQQS